MKNILDLTSKISKQALDVLFFSDPFRTSMGVTLGISLHEFSSFLFSVISNATQLEIPKISLLGFIATCVFLLHAKFLFKRESNIPPEAQKILEMMQAGKRSGFSDAESKRQFRLFVQQYANEIALSRKFKKELEDIGV